VKQISHSKLLKNHKTHSQNRYFEYRLGIIGSKSSSYSDKVVIIQFTLPVLFKSIFRKTHFIKNDEKIEIFIDKKRDGLDAVKGNTELTTLA